MIQTLKEKFALANITLTDAQCEKFAVYYEFLVEYNKKVNLTAITDVEGVIVKHFLDSAINASELKDNASLADIGSGAGFPAVPIKIIREDVTVTMIESNGKRVTFLEELIKKLDLTGISAVKMRAEEAGRSELRESFDYVTSRAVTALPALMEYSIPLLKVSGKMLAYKSGEIQEELQSASRAVQKLGSRFLSLKKYVLLDEYARSLVVVEKINSTDKVYPRPNKKIISNPL
ncbi:MAG: 16S rRNA (guanine(527)-N(7))-methyltransferase RsmG [Clostridia bacterium]|nr:16S rRNA (guanine(527)-N(7))-methyltransferase RsmG [Clostridia bacterium]